MKKTVKPAKKIEPAKKAKAAAPAKVMAKSTKKAEPKVKLSLSKASKNDEKIEELALEVVIEAAEEEEEAMESAAARSSGANEAGLAIAAATAETSAGSLKNFRHHPDIENFYRFIYENDLRYEGLEIIDLMAAQREIVKSTKVAKAKTH